MSTTRLQRLFEAHAAVSKTLRQALSASAESQKDMFNPTYDTEAAKISDNTPRICMTLAEAHALLRLALPPSARTIPLRIEHAMLMLHITRLLDELGATSTQTVPYTAIAAGQHLAVALRDWLVTNNQVVMAKGDRLSDSMVGRPRTPDAINRVPKARKSKPGALLPAGFPPCWHIAASDTSRGADPLFVHREKPQNAVPRDTLYGHHPAKKDEKPSAGKGPARARRNAAS